eukprot:4555210-Pyramimonas_sp.AAC.1
MDVHLKRHALRFSFHRLRAEAAFASIAFTFYDGLSPCNAHAVRQTTKLPDLGGPDLGAPEWTGQGSVLGAAPWRLSPNPLRRPR